MQNLAGFIFPHTDTPKTHPVSPFPIGIHRKPARFYTQTFGERHFGAYAFAPLHGCIQNLAGFIFPHPDTPKTHPVLGANLRRETFGGVCNTPLHGYAKNAPDFTLPNKDAPKTRPVLDPNLRRGYLRGVCNTPLHGYMKNPAGFRPRPLARDISGRMQYAPTRVHRKMGRFHISAHDIA